MSTPGHLSFIPIGACGVNHFGLCLDFMPFSPCSLLSVTSFYASKQTNYLPMLSFLCPSNIYNGILYTVDTHTHRTAFLTQLLWKGGIFIILLSNHNYFDESS